MNKDLMFSSSTDLWETPQEFFDELNAEFDFTLDACALPENAKCENFYTPEQDGLSQPWGGVTWCNPPYGREIGKWVRRGFLAAEDGATVVMLLPARTDTQWFHDYIRGKAEVRFIKGRLKFGGSSNSAPFPSMLAIFWPRDKEGKVKKTDYSKALDIAAKWLEQAGACTYIPGYICDKDYSKPGTCAKCLRRHLLKLAREAET